MQYPGVKPINVAMAELVGKDLLKSNGFASFSKGMWWLGGMLVEKVHSFSTGPII